MTRPHDAVPRLFHLALADEWQAALAGGSDYRRSTLGRSLDDEGFVHCSFGDQVAATAERFYAGRDDVVLLEVDPSRLRSELRVEALHGAEAFPHVYGPIPLGAVVAVTRLGRDDTGRFVLPELG